MLDFKKYIITERKDVVINRLKNLSRKEKKKVIDFFKKYPQREDEIDWNDKTLDITDFQVVFHTKTTSQKKRDVKKKGVKGLSEGVDYIDASFLFNNHQAYIPLSWEAAKRIASRYIGKCEGAWCIAYQKDESYWRKHVGRDKLLFIFIITDKNEKYALTINLTGKPVRHYDTTIKHNGWVIYDKSDKMFKKNILKGEDLHKIVRSNRNYLNKWWKTLHKKNDSGKVKNYSELDGYDDAVSTWEQMARDIENYAQHRVDDEEEWYNNMKQIITDTIEKYKELADEAEERAKVESGTRRFNNYKDRADSFRALMIAEPEGTGVDPKTGEPVWHIRGTEPKKDDYYKDSFLKGNVHNDGIPYTRRELQAFIDTFEKEKKRIAVAGVDDLDFSDRDEYLDIIHDIEGVEPYEVIDDYNGQDYGHVEWTDNFYDYEYEYGYAIDFYPGNSSYDDYFEFVEQYDDSIEREHYDHHIGENGWEGINGEEELQYMEYYHPDDILDKYFAGN